MSVQPTVSLGGFEITPPFVLRLKCDSGPNHVSFQHFVALEEEPESEDDVKILNTSAKRPASRTAAKTPQKQAKLLDDDEDEDDDDEDEDDFDEEEEEKIPLKKPAQDLSSKNTPKSKQNGKESKTSTLVSKSKTPASNKKENKPQSPKSPKSTPFTKGD
ncbi:nucleophosmin-like [Trachemys scripta elegans]|uniref:nucleophosmin-like n=1 Tax=Trachemys scripta elegans TaxID=31138 RepID=UPI00155768EA|nr:nucleophosmin-like [Trachemys scripta elegans]